MSTMDDFFFFFFFNYNTYIIYNFFSYTTQKPVKIQYFTVHTSYIDHIIYDNVKKRKLNSSHALPIYKLNYNNISI